MHEAARAGGGVFAGGLSMLNAVGEWHNLQLVLRQMDADSARPSRGLEGPLGALGNTRDPADSHGPASA